MDINTIIIYIMVACSIIGIVDIITGNRLGIGKCFESGIKAIGTLTLSMAGILILAPVIGSLLKPIIDGFGLFGQIDPGMIVGMILAVDMGGAPLADKLCLTSDGYVLSGIITASMLGATISFTIPVSMGIVKGEMRKVVAKGILIGLTTIPLGVITGGLLAGLEASFVLPNTIPVAVISAIIIICLIKWEHGIIRVFTVFSRLIQIISMIGIGVAIISQLTGYEIIQGTMAISQVLEILINIAFMLSGAFVLVGILSAVIKRIPASRNNRLNGDNSNIAPLTEEKTISGLLICLANNIPAFEMLEGMSEGGRLIVVAFSVSGSFVLGDHLGFISGYDPQYIYPLCAAKIIAGVSAAIIAYLYSRRSDGFKE